jgi:hypothetical protein
LSGEVPDKLAQLITTALGLVAALLWNTAIQNLFERVFGKAGAALASQSLYAILIKQLAKRVPFFASNSARFSFRGGRPWKKTRSPVRNVHKVRLPRCSCPSFWLKCWPAELLLSRKGFTLSEKGPRPEGPLFEILRGDAVHPILELVHDLFFGGFFHRLFEHDTGLLDDFVGGEDLCSRADGEGYGVRWP